MGYSVKNPKTHRTLFLHEKMSIKGEHLYYFSYEIVGAIDLPPIFEVKFAKYNGHPYIIKKGVNNGE